MAINFPSSPTNGQTFTSGGLTWTWNSTSTTWESTNSFTTIANGLGSAASPSYTFTGDTDTGMFSPEADTVAFTEGGTETLRINSSGNVGIGTSSPAYNLDVNGSIRSFSGEVILGDLSAGLGYSRIHNEYTSASKLVFENGEEGILFRTGAGTFLSDMVFIDPTGLVGIGTTTPLHLLSLAGSGTIGININSLSGSGANFSLVTDDSVAEIITQPSIPLSFKIDNIERFRINTSGSITSANLADAVGYKGIPQSTKTSAYTLALADIGTHISITTGGVVIPANSSVAFPIGSTIVVYNDSASAQNISITTDTLRLGGTATTGTRSLAQRGIATCIKIATTEWVVTGNVT